MKKFLFLLMLATISFVASAQNRTVLLIDEFNVKGDSSYAVVKSYTQADDGTLTPVYTFSLTDEVVCDTCIYSSTKIESLVIGFNTKLTNMQQEIDLLKNVVGDMSLEIHQDTLYIKGSSGLIIKTE